MIRVLVVDDDFMVAKVHAAFVGRTPGFEVVGVAGAEGVQAGELVLVDAASGLVTVTPDETTVADARERAAQRPSTMKTGSIS